MLVRAAHLVRNFGFGFFSIAVHLCMVIVAVLIAAPTVRAYDQQRLIDVDLQPALGQPHGKDDGKSLGSHMEIPRAHDFKAPERTPPPAPASDPNAIPTTTASASAAPSPSAAPPAAEADAGVPTEAGATDLASGDPATPAGSANVAPAFGSPDGVEGGQGTAPPKAKMTPQYAGILAGWFGARFNVRGLSIPPDELGKLSVSVRVSLSQDRHVTAWSLGGSSGNTEFDDAVKQAMTSIQGGGATLPPPPDGGDPPPAFTTRFGPVRVKHD